MAPAEMLVEVRVPKLGSSAGWSYVKMARRAQDWATVGVAAVVEKSNGSLGNAAIGLTNMGATPIRARPQKRRSPAVRPQRTPLSASPTAPIRRSDHAASSEFRRHLAEVLGKRALDEAATRS